MMNGRLASIIGPVDLTPGISVARERRATGGKAALSALKAGIAAASVLRQLRHRVLQRDVLARERIRGRVEVGDQVLEVLRVGVDRAGHRALGGDPVRQVVGLDPERVVGDDRRVLVGRQPVLDRGVVGRAALLDRGAVLLEQRLQVVRACRTAARSAPGRAGPARFPAGSGTCGRRARPAPTDVPGLTSTKKLPSRKMRGRIAKVASVCSGSPCLSIVIVTSAAWHRGWRSAYASLAARARR